MKLVLVRGSSYTHFGTRQVFKAGVVVDVPDDLGKDLASRTENGVPYFRVIFDDVKTESKPEPKKKGGVNIVPKSQPVQTEGGGVAVE